MRPLPKITNARQHDESRAVAPTAAARSAESDSLLHLQHTAGNRAVRRLLQGEKRDEEETERPGPSAQPEETPAARTQETPDQQQKPPSAEPAQPQAPGEKAPEETVAGTIPDIETPEEEERETSPEGEEGGVEGLAAESPAPAGRGNVTADLQLSFSQPKVDGLVGGKDDPVTSSVSAGSFKQPGTKKVKKPFGSESYKPAFSGVSFSCSGGQCTITAKLDVNCPWGTNAGGRTDVPSATDAVVTKTSWSDIKDDLKPGASSPFKSRRKKYYSKALVEQHEKFHGTEDDKWTRSSGLQIVKKRIEAGNILPGAAAIGVKILLGSARRKLIRENTKWYEGGGTSHDSYAGEIAAYADGKDEYQKLADDVEKHGKSLP